MGIKELIESRQKLFKDLSKVPPVEVERRVSERETEDRRNFLRSGQTHWPYEIGDVCNVGSVGELRSAINMETGQEMVLKYQRPGISAICNQGRVQHIFRREAQFLAQFDHPNIVKSQPAFVHNGIIYIPMECLDLGMDDFFTQVPSQDDPEEREEQPTKEEVYTFMKDAAAAMSYLHSKGIVHCDIKRKQFMFRKGYEVKLTDFGSARRIGDPLRYLITTQDYFPTKHSLKRVEPAIDLYAFGVMLDKLATDMKGPIPTYITSIIGRCMEAVHGKQFTAGQLEDMVDTFGHVFMLRPEYRPKHVDLYTGEEIKPQQTTKPKSTAIEDQDTLTLLRDLLDGKFYKPPQNP